MRNYFNPLRAYISTLKEERTFVFSRMGYWNLAGDTQVQMGCRLAVPEPKRGMIYFVIRNSKADYAMQRDGTLVTPEGASLFPQLPAASEEEPEAAAPSQDAPQ
ncbi:MAG: hypothetical protein HFI42_13495 [Lachnospiraceae bacterium]|nr:hypothetical protein [Lachnospiraceae bacterium]